MMIADQIKKDLAKVLEKLKISSGKLALEHPGQPEHGDYSTSFALQVKKKAYPTPWDLANAIVNTWRSQGLPDYLAKIEVVQPGFINIWLKNEVLIKEMERVLREKDKYGSSAVLKNKKILLEHTSPNPQTTIMLGHLRNNFLGMSSANILKFLGAKLTRDCIVNDRGIHLCRSIWGYLVFGQKRTGLTKSQLLNFKKVTEKQIRGAIRGIKWQELLAAWVKKKSGWWQPKNLGLKPDHANLIWYVLGSRAFSLSERVKSQVKEILIAWEAEDEKVWQLWRQILNWSDKGYRETYKRIGNIHDWAWYESDHYKEGKQIVALGLKKRVFRHSKGAVVTDLKKYGLPDTVVVKTDGTALYITQDLALTKLKMKKFPSDLYIWCIGGEQTLYFKQLFAICEQLGFGKRENFFHLNYALINFKGRGKMSTRRGDVVKADEVMDEMHERMLKTIKSTNQKLRGKLTPKQLGQLTEKVTLGAIKYSLLKLSRDTTIQFDIDESINLEGDSGPYLQYTYARCRSVLRRAGISNFQFSIFNSEPAEEELALLRAIYKFLEVVAEAGENYTPNLICNFLFELARKYNLFYNRQPIIKAEPEQLADFRLALTAVVAQVIKNGLYLVGIEAPERM